MKTLPFTDRSEGALTSLRSFEIGSEDKKNGKAIKDRDLKKHRNDVFRLVYLLPAEFEMEMPDPVAADLRNFLLVFAPGSDQWKGILQALRESRLEVRLPEELLSEIKAAYKL